MMKLRSSEWWENHISEQINEKKIFKYWQSKSCERE